MWDDLILALRNAGRNRRRSLVTVLALALCCAGLVLFAGYVAAIFRGDESRTVSNLGHLQIFHRDFPEKGVGNPAAFVIEDHEALRAELLADPVLAPLIEAISGQLVFAGLASHYEKGASAAFVGFGVDPREHNAIAEWNPYRLVRPQDLPVNRLIHRTVPEVDADDPQGGTLGVGLARILDISARNNPPPMVASAPPPSETETGDAPNFAALEAATAEVTPGGDGMARPTIELLCHPRAGGLPGVATLGVRSLKNCATLHLDDCQVTLHLSHASALLFPGEPIRVNDLVVLLHRSADTDLAATRVRAIIEQGHPGLECRTWTELSPFYRQITAYLRGLFAFMFGIIATIVVFTIYNTLSAAIVERTGEIGTLRAMGADRGTIARLFVLEGGAMGVAGGLLGVLLAAAIGAAINAADIVYEAPTTSTFVKLEILIGRAPGVMVFGFCSALATSLVSAILPARHAARLSIVEALRHG
jgi:putative ABC transport system permease protein